MKKGWLALAAILALTTMLSGCGMILVEDSEPVRIGMDAGTED